MSVFQSTVAASLTLGVPGELFNDGPRRGQPVILNSDDVAYNVIGATAITLVSQSQGQASTDLIIGKAGGTGKFLGILATPKAMVAFGTVAGGPLAATLKISNGVAAEVLEMAEMFVTLPAAANIGDLLVFDNTTGALSTVAPDAAFTGVIAVTTGVLTVSAISAGSLGVGSVVKDASGNILATITGLGTGTGGNGTYNTNIVTAVSSAAMTANSKAASGKTFVPNAVVWEYTLTAAGVAVAKLTN